MYATEKIGDSLKFVVVGILSYDDECGSPNKPG
jgi:hypothetical protein